jgi:hypothetical protein
MCFGNGEDIPQSGFDRCRPLTDAMEMDPAAQTPLDVPLQVFTEAATRLPYPSSSPNDPAEASKTLYVSKYQRSGSGVPQVVPPPEFTASNLLLPQQISEMVLAA